MICRFCVNNILESRSKKLWGFHHHNPDDFESSAAEGCVFCSRLFKHVRLRNFPRPWFGRADPGKAAYRWSVRKAAGTSESQESIAIIFRSLPVCDDETELTDRRYKNKRYLPDETFYLLLEQDKLTLPFSNELGYGTASIQCWSRVSKWVKTCLEEHTGCQQSFSDLNLYPKRLVDLGAERLPWPPLVVRIVSSEEVNQGDGLQRRYVTLSHSWGLDPSFAQLQKETLDEWTHVGIPWAEICSNKNFMQAIEVARHLGIRYIWIDSLCIIQHNSDDWEEEAPMMRDIYRNSFCNIAASDSADSKGGLFRTRSADRIAAGVYRGVHGRSISLLAGKTWRIIAESTWHGDLLNGPLYKRGWVFQERMLAPRILHYSKEQAFWDCSTISACESFPHGLPQQLDTFARVDRRWRSWLRAPGHAQHMNVDEFWSSAVRTYTSNHLTFHKDKLKAIYGVGSIVAEAQRGSWGDWVAGLWSSRLEDHLTWSVLNPQEATRPSSGLGSGAAFPTWSWASVEGAVQLAKLWASSPVYIVANHTGGRISFPKVSNFVHDPFAAMKLELRCHVGSGVLRHQHKHDRLVLEVAGAAEGEEGFIQVLPDTSLAVGGTYEFLVLLVSKKPVKLRTQDGRVVISGFGDDDTSIEFNYSGFGLLIEEDNSRAHHYRRIGVIKFSELNLTQWQEARRACGDSDDNREELSPLSMSAKLLWLV
ncbi:putative Heterokaryon incompatibility domain-containing protein [Seiridium cardinale]|uniref:Heterokaryon incompatibility domain-containing protein n=1 Tax=Seiridium cardinale TaxID=138064 RepID=A0ABR2XEV9_9PEZI